MNQAEKDEFYARMAEKILNAFEGKTQKDKSIVVAKLLDITVSAVYNKVKGRSRFTIDELVIMAREVKMSLDVLLLMGAVDKSYIPFYADGLKFSPRSYKEFLENFNHYFSMINQLPNVHGYFIANEATLFHLLGHPQLMYLKLYLWNKINWQIPGISTMYNPDSLMCDPAFVQEAKLLKDRFYSFDSTEIWNPNMLDNILKQFRFFEDSQFIKDPTIKVQFKKELFDLIAYFENLCITGEKPQNSRSITHKSNIYYSELNLGSEMIMVESDKLEFYFQQVDIPNYMRTTDPRMIAKLKKFYTSVSKMSTNITVTGERERVQLFNQFRERCERL
jgi:BetR domain